MLGNIVLIGLLLVSIYGYFKVDITKNSKRSSWVVILVLLFALMYRIF